MKNRNCDQCGKDYEYKLSTSKFCSDICRVKYSNLHKGEKKESTSEETKPAKVLNGLTVQQQQALPSLPPAAQYIINHQEKEIKRWEDQYKEEVADHKKLREQYQALKDEIATLKTDQKIEEMAKPSGLDGIMEHPVVVALMPHIGPSIGKLLDKHLVGEGMSTTQMMGIEGQLDGEPAQWAKSMLQWYVGLPVEAQAAFAGLVNELTKVTPNELPNTIAKIINVVSNGTTISKPNVRVGGF